MVINEIDTADISFVVQGAVDPKITPECLKSIRNNFPQSIIVLSTWEGTDVSGLIYDELILSKDPGTAVYSLDGTMNNINRQLVSSYAGLSAVKTTYAAKVRSDLFFESPTFLHHFEKFPKYSLPYKKVKGRMITLTMYTRAAFSNIFWQNGVHPANFHPSDWFTFGYTQDVKKYYSAPLVDLLTFSSYFLQHEEEKNPYLSLTMQMAPESYFGIHFFEMTQYSSVYQQCQYDYREAMKYLVNNFIVLDYEYSHIYSLKWETWSRNEWTRGVYEIPGLVFYGDFLKYYKRYCDPTFIIPNRIDKVIYKRKFQPLKDELWRNAIKVYVKENLSKLKRCFAPVKKVMRLLFPAYRVGCGVRDELLELKQHETDRFNYLVYRCELLTQQQQKNMEEIKRLKKMLSMPKQKESD